MKALLESLVYPQNIFLWLFFIACIFYRKKGLWLLLLFYYLLGNTFIANQVRQLYKSNVTPVTERVASGGPFVVLGCGGSANQLPACAKARLSHLSSQVPSHNPAAVIITTRYCQPYVDFLLSRQHNLAVDCFDGGDNTYQEFHRLQQRLPATQTVQFITSDYHAWRVKQLIDYHQLNATISAVSSQTFRPLNCSWSCFLTVNLSNFDLYSKLMAEVSSYAVYTLSRSFVDWQPEPDSEHRG